MFSLTLRALLFAGSIGMGTYGLYQWICNKRRIALVWCIAAGITLFSFILDFTVFQYLISAGHTELLNYLINLTDFLIVVAWAYAVYRDGFNS